MINYSWPGNIRELENVVQRAVLLSKKSHLEMSLLPPAILGATATSSSAVSNFSIMRGQTLRDALEGPERQIILEVLKLNNFSRNLTAEQLGINRTTLYKKMKRLGLDTVQCQD